MTMPTVPHADAPLALALADDSPERQAARAALQAVDAARAHGHPVVLCEALTDAARCLAALQAYAQSEDYLRQALEWAGLLHSHDLRTDLLCALAEVACNEADLSVARRDDSPDGLASRKAARERAHDWAVEAAVLAGRTSDTNWEMKVLLRASDVLERGGEHDAAAALQNRAITLLGLGGAPAVDIELDLPLADDFTSHRWTAEAPRQLM